MHELTEWNLKDILLAHEGVEFEALLKELHNKVDSFAASRNRLTSAISEIDFLSLKYSSMKL